MVIHSDIKRKKPTTRPSLAAHIRVSPYDASSEPDDGFFMLDAVCDHARQKIPAEFRPFLFSCYFNFIIKNKSSR